MAGIYRFPILPLPVFPSAPPPSLQLSGPPRRFRRVVLVLRTTDVREVLANDAGPNAPFSVADYGEHMQETVGRFFLGMDQAKGGAYKQEKDLAVRAFLAGTAPGSDPFAQLIGELTNVAREEAIDAIESVQGPYRPEIDVVTDLANRVPLKLVERHFGIHDYGTLLQDCQEITFYIFNFMAEIPLLQWVLRLRRRAVKAGARLQENIGSQVKNRWNYLKGPTAPPPGKTVLDRLLQSNLNPADETAHLELVRRILTGLISGSTVATVAQFTAAVNRLMDLPPNERRTLQYAALAAAVRENPEPLWSYLREAARFGAMPGFLTRRCRLSYTLARGSRRETRVFPGDVIALSPHYAGRDPFAFHDPATFNPGRPESSYTLFGHGLHACIGAFLGKILMVEMAAQLFMLRGLERDPKRGRLVSYRSIPKHFVLNYLP